MTTVGAGILDPLRSTANEHGDDIRWTATVLRGGERPLVLDDVDGGAVLPTASIGKLFLLLAVLDDIDAGRLDPDEQLSVIDDDLVADSGLLQFLDHQTMSVLDLARLVGAVSDNLATNVLLRRVGLDRVGHVAERLGVVRCQLHDKVRDVRTAEHPPFLSTGSAAELADLARRIRIGRAISPVASEALVELLRVNTDLSMVAAGLGLDPLAHVGDDLGIRLFNKTGSQVGTRADVGGIEAIAAGEWRLVTYAVIARFVDSGPTRRAVLDAMRTVGGRIGAAVRVVS